MTKTKQRFTWYTTAEGAEVWIQETRCMGSSWAKGKVTHRYKDDVAVMLDYNRKIVRRRYEELFTEPQVEE